MFPLNSPFHSPFRTTVCSNIDNWITPSMLDDKRGMTSLMKENWKAAQIPWKNEYSERYSECPVCIGALRVAQNILKPVKDLASGRAKGGTNTFTDDVMQANGKKVGEVHAVLWVKYIATHRRLTGDTDLYHIDVACAPASRSDDSSLTHMVYTVCVLLLWLRRLYFSPAVSPC